MSDLIHLFARNLRLLRKRAGLSQEELALRAGLHRTYVGSVERGERNISLRSIERLACALNVDPPVLLSVNPSALLPQGDSDDNQRD